MSPPSPSPGSTTGTSTPPAATHAAMHPALLLIGMVLVGLNLRPALSSVAPVLGPLCEDLGLSAAAAGLLTTLPVLCLGLAAPLAPRLARRRGPELTVFLVLFLLAGGLLLRTVGGVPGLFAGTLLAGAGIGIIGVLLPGIVKRDFAHKPGAVTGLYTMALSLGAAIGAGASEPLRLAADGRWQPALGFWAIPAVVAALVWALQLRRGSHALGRRGHTVRGLWNDPLAWQVTAYMGLQSSLAYCVFGWLPTILVDRGYSAQSAGYLMSVSILVQLITAFAGPWLATRGRDQRSTIALMAVLTAAGLLGCLYAPQEQTLLWAVVLGLGQGGNFSVALTLLVLRAGDSHIAAHLSGMAQGVGYTVAALGPFAIGLLHQFTGSWDGLGWLFGLICLATLAAGMGAGRKLHVGAVSEPVQ